jgi:transcriptional regulator
MYVPAAFEEKRIPVLHDFIRAQPFASLITLGSSGLFASHLPLVLDDAVAPLGILRGHLSRANAQWREISAAVQSLAIFAGPHHYITPNWYPEKESSGKVVPTWNYAVIHAYGNLRIIEDPDWLLANVTSLTTIHEASSPSPWKVSDAPADYISSMLKGIVGLEFHIERLEGKWKLNQNRPEMDRRAVAEGLHALNTPESLAMEDLVRNTFARQSAQQNDPE